MKDLPETAERHPAPAASLLPGLAENQKLAFAVVRFQARVMKAALQYQAEALGFLRHRLEQDVKLLDGLVSEDGFADAFDVVGVYMQNAASDYAAEASKVAALGSTYATDAARQVRRQAEEVIADMAARTVA